MGFTPTSSIRPVGQGAKLVAALQEAALKFPGDREAQAAYVKQAMQQQAERTPGEGR